MNEIIKTWLINIYEEAISEARMSIRNEHIWELGYDDSEDDYNPHTANIINLQEYIKILTEKIAELETE